MRSGVKPGLKFQGKARQLSRLQSQYVIPNWGADVREQRERIRSGTRKGYRYRQREFEAKV
jgi:hypothetical protein